MTIYMNIANLSCINTVEMSDVITAVMKRHGQELNVEFRPVTKHVFDRKLLVVINGHVFDELNATDEVVKLKDAAHDRKKKVLESDHETIRKFVFGVDNA